jgi:hypothetical protein
MVNGIETSMKKREHMMQHVLRFSQKCKYLVFKDVTLHFWEAFGSNVQETVTVMLCHILEDQNPQNIKIFEV